VIGGIVGTDLRVVDWQQANSSFFTAVQVERNVMFLILTLIIWSRRSTSISSMIMLVKDKGRDIAILRTMGATRGMVLRIFFLSGASVGVIGTLSGLVLGVSFTENIETIRQWLQGLTGTTLFRSDDLFPVAPAGTARLVRGRPDRRHGARAVGPGDDLSVLARGAARSRRGAAL